MKRTQIQLDPKKFQRVKRHGERTGRSVAKVIREAIDSYLEKLELREVSELEAVAGKFTPLAQSIANSHDQYFIDSILSGKKY